MPEYIAREALLADIEKRYCQPCEAEGKDYNHVRCRACWVDDMMGEIGEAPFYDVAPVVRCYECKHYTKSMMLCDHEGGLDTPDKMDFCSYGEPKDGDN